MNEQSSRDNEHGQHGQRGTPTGRARRITLGALAAVALGATLVPAQAADVGVSVQISQPGVYGRIDIGRFPQPVLLAPQPVLITQPARRPPPVYMWVPDAQRLHWGRYCGQYGACGTPVYFVQDHWYHQHVRPQHVHGPQRPHGPPPARGWRDGRGGPDRHSHPERRDNDRHDGRGNDRDHDRRGPPRR